MGAGRGAVALAAGVTMWASLTSGHDFLATIRIIRSFNPANSHQNGNDEPSSARNTRALVQSSPSSLRASATALRITAMPNLRLNALISSGSGT